jgi:hypothetical protein
MGERTLEGFCYLFLGEGYREQGDLVRAEQHYRLALPVFRQLGDGYSESWVTGQIALVAPG